MLAIDALHGLLPKKLWPLLAWTVSEKFCGRYSQLSAGLLLVEVSVYFASGS